MTGALLVGCGSTHHAVGLAPAGTPDENFLNALAASGENVSGDPSQPFTWAYNQIEAGHQDCKELAGGWSTLEAANFDYSINQSSETKVQAGVDVQSALKYFCPDVLTDPTATTLP